MAEGYLGLFRSFFRGDLWHESRAFSRAEAWLDLLQFAAYMPTKRLVNGKFIHHEIGEFVAAERFLEKRWKWGRTKVRNFIKNHEKAQELDHRTDQGEIVRRICKYETYVFRNTTDQTNDQTNDQPENNPKAYQGRTKVKKDKKVNNPKREKASLSEVIEYAKSRGLPATDGEHFFHSQEAGGWKRNGEPIKSWKNAFVTWQTGGYLPSQKQSRFIKPPTPDTGPPMPKKLDLPEPDFDWKSLLLQHQRQRSWEYWCNNEPHVARILAKRGKPFGDVDPVSFDLEAAVKNIL